VKRWTNQVLFVVLGIAFTTGWLAFFYDSAPSRWSLILHASSGYAILALTPWKSAIARRGIRRERPGRWLSLVLSVSVAISIVAGILHSTGLLRSAGEISAMEVHVGAALVALPLAVWHLAARWIPVRVVDLSRRNLLRSGALIAAAGATYASTEAVVRFLQLPGAQRRLTGSYEFGSLEADALPVTQWLFDAIPLIDSAAWQLELRAGNLRTWSYNDLLAFDDRLRATLDCTGGFYSVQDWSGVWLSRLLPAGISGSSIHVRSITGYDRRFALSDASRLLLATRLGGAPLPSGHGFPVRLVAPGRRGYWWVKWVSAISIEDLPVFWQLPFPAQ
jgi:molybdopterin-dependent oxidoreductase-like protein protein